MKQKPPRRATRRMPSRLQRGIMLIEALVAIAIFSFAILGLVGLQATSIRTVRDADYRAKASMFAHQIVARMWVDRLAVGAYALNAGTTAPCAGGTNTSSTPAVNEWLAALKDPVNPGSLPGAGNLQQQILVKAGNHVTVTLCWKTPQDLTPRMFELTTQIGG